jgi:RHS repeat-associated protein
MGMVDRIGKGWLGTASLVVFNIFIALPAAMAGWNQPLRASQSTLLPADLPELSPGPGGTLSAEIGLAMPAATGEGGVDLSLTFTGGHTGLLGNWDLDGLSSIERERSEGIQFQATDTFQSSAGGRMLASGGKYYTENDSGAIYQPQGSCGQGPCSWLVLTPDGGKMLYGGTSDSVLKGPSDIVGASSTVVEWLLSRVEDVNGNYATIEYERKNGRLYPATIEYTKNDSVSLVERRVEFEYADHTTPRISYDAGNRTDTTQYLSAIRTYYGNEEIFAYEFQYSTDARTGQYRLIEVQEKLKGEVYRKPVRINYRSAPDAAVLKPVTGVNTGAGTPDPGVCKVASDWCLLSQYSDFLNPGAAFVVTVMCLLYRNDGTIGRCETGNTWSTADVNGDGRLDFVASTDAVNDRGRTVVPLDGAPQPWTASSDNGQKGTTFMTDMNGDGLDDVVGLGIDMGDPFNGIPTTYFFLVSLNKGNGFESARRFSPPNGIMGMGYDPHLFAKQILLMWISAQLSSMAAKKQGANDFFKRNGSIVGGSLNRVWSGTTAFSKSKVAGLMIGQQVLSTQGSADNFSQMADMNGDGLVDFVRLITPTKVAVAINNGKGYSHDVTSIVDSGISTGGEFTPTAEVNLEGLEDLDGDGDSDEDDLALLPEEEQQAYAEKTTISVGATSPGGFRSMGDVNGDGVPDFIVLINEGSNKRLKAFYGQRDGSFSGYVLSAPLDPGDKDSRYILDANGDGYSDFVRLTGENDDQMTVTYGTGTGFGATVTKYVGSSAKMGRSFADVNGDGAPDFVRFVADGSGYEARVKYFRGDGYGGDDVSLNFRHGSSHELNTRFVFWGDANGDGRSELIAPRSGAVDIYGAPADSPELISSVSNGYQTLTVGYDTAANTTAVNTTLGKREDNASIIPNTSPRFLVKEIVTSGLSGPKGRVTFSYENDMIRIGPTYKDSRPLGPQRRTTRSYVWNGSWIEAPTYSVEEFHHDHPEFGYDAAGLPVRSLVYRTDGTLLQEESYSFADTASIAGTKRFSPSIQVSIDHSKTLEGGGALEIRKTQTVLAFDSLGNPTCSVENVFYNGQVSSGETRATKTTFSYSNDGTRPFALPVEETVRAGSNCDGGTMLSYRTFGYDSVGNATVVSEGPSSATLVTTLRTYDAVGNVLTETRFGRTTTQVYDTDTRSQVVRTISPMGLESVREYNLALGLLLKETDSDGRTIEHEYDELGRKIKTTLKPPGFLSGSHVLETKEYSFSAADGSSTESTTKASAGTGSISQFTMTDEWGRTVQSRRYTAGGWITADREYDAFDRVIKESLPYFDGQSPTGYSETTYDSLGRPIRVTRPGPNGTIVQDFDPDVVSMTSFTSDDGVLLVGLAQKEDRQNGQVVYQYKTADGRALATLHSTAYSTPNQPDTQISGWNRSRFHYDSRGQLRQITRGIGTSRTPAEDSDLTSSVTYDEWGRRSQVFDPDKGISRYTYTEEGQPLCDTDPDGLTICRSYDTYGRLLSVTRQSDGRVLSQYFYDETESTLGTGRLTSVKDESGTRRMHYDGLTGKPARIERTYNALGNEKQFDIENTYDETGALVKRTFPSINVSLRYDYHAGGPLATMQIEDPDHRILSSGSVLDVVRTSIPDAFGNIGTITYGNGVVIQSRYSSTGMVQQVTTQGNGPLSDYLYRWNDEGMLVEKQDLLVADGINRSEQFSYDRSRRLVEATGPYGDRNTPHRTLQYAYGMDGQPIVADEKVYNYDVSNPHRLKSFNQRSYAYDNDTTPDKNKGLVVERRAPGNVVSRFQYHWTGRIKQAQTINGGTVTTVDYEYDTEGNRFIKRTDLGGIVTEIHDLSSDYRIYADGSSEVHTIEIRNGNDPVARFRFQDNHHNSGVWAPSSLFSHRLGADLLRIAALEGGITKLPTLMAFAAHDAYHAVKLLPQIQNKARLLVFLYWTLASLIALAALVLLVRAWRRNPDDGPGLLPVAVYRFGSVLALLSFSATGCIVVPQTQDGSEYLLAANGLFRGTSEGGESNIMSVLGAFYYISTHNGSTDIVTNGDGAPVARFVYEPFGKVNSDLTDLDPDRNGVHYGEQFQFTGQEYEPETGLYNYKARLYDPETGRFLQPDPVHTDQPGQDNWDRYQYVWNNPVNFVDPDGEAGCFPNTMYGHNFSGPSACGILPDASERFLVNGLLMIALLAPPEARQKLTNIMILLWFANFRPKNSLTKVDKVSMRHDVEQKHVFDTTHKKKSIDADWRWIRDGWGAMFSSNYFPDTYQREYDATPEWWGDARGLVAGVNTIGTFMADLFVLNIGTRLFGLHIMVNAIATAGDALARAVTPKYDLKVKSNVSLKTPLFNVNASINMKLIGKSRFKNLNKISKWRL